jgi:hypothetical protein
MMHFNRHLKRPDTHPLVRKTLQKMIDDEEGHLGWVWQELKAYSRETADGEVEATMRKLKAIDQHVYERIAAESPFKEYFG